MSFTVLGHLAVSVDGVEEAVPGRRERAVLAVLLAAGREVVSADRLIEEVWGPDADALASLQVAVSRLRKIIEPDRAPRGDARLLVSTGGGYALRIPPQAVDAERFAALVEQAHEALRAGDAARAVCCCEQAGALWTGTPYAEISDSDLVRAERTRLEELRGTSLELHAEALLAVGRHGLATGLLESLTATYPLRERLAQLRALSLYRGGRQADALAALRQVRALLLDELGVDPAPGSQELEAAILRQDPGLELRAQEPSARDRTPAHRTPGHRTSAEWTAADGTPVDGTRADGTVAEKTVPPTARDGSTRREVGPAQQGPEASGRRQPAALQLPGAIPPLVGRDAEFGQLRASFAECQTGEARFVLVEGEAGIGKTRVLEELAAHATRSGGLAVWGRCSETGIAPAYWPWLEVLRALLAAGRCPNPPDEVAATLLDAPELSPAVAVTDERRFRLFEAVAAMLAAAAAKGPLVVLLEDLHWADPASAELLHHLADRLRELPLLVVGSLRPLDLGRDDAVAVAVSAIARRAASRRVTLAALPAAASPALVCAALARDVLPEVAAAIHRRAEGNPFCIRELSRLLAAEGVIDDPEAALQAQMPATVRDVLRLRLAALPPATRDVLEVAAVAGRRVDLPVLVTASGRSVDECLDALEPALASRVLVPVPESPGQHRFAHALMQEAALADVSSLRAARLHARVADAVLATGGGEDILEVVAGHLWVAVGIVGRTRAASALEAAAAVALRRTAYETAETHLARALSLRQAEAGTPAADEAELGTTLQLANLRVARYGFSRALPGIRLDRAKQVSRRSGLEALYAGLLVIRWGALCTTCQVSAARDLAAELRDLAAASDDPALRVLGDSAWGIQCWHLGRIDEAAEHMQRVHDALGSFDADVRARAIELGGALFPAFAVYILDLAGRLPDADARFQALVDAATEPYGAMVVANFGGFAGACEGDPARTLRWASLGVETDADDVFDFFGASARAYAGWAMAVTSDPQRGARRFEEGLDRYRRTGARTCLGVFVLMHVEASLAAGVPVEAVRATLMAEAREVEESGERFALPYLDLARARAAAAEGASPEVTTGLVERAIASAEAMGMGAAVRRAAARLTARFEVDPVAVGS